MTKHPKDKRRRRDSHVKSAPAKMAAETFIEAFTTDAGRGKQTRAAQRAYPNQKRGSAAMTGSRLIQDPYVQEQIKIRQQACRQLAGVTREDIIGNLVSIIYGAHDDILGKEGEIDWEKARERGIAHLIQEVERTERHSKDGSSRVTTKYKLPSKIHAMDLLTEMTGWKREAQRNPIDLARQTYTVMRQNERYRDVSDGDLAKFPAEKFKVSVGEILEGQTG